ncbi:hypothetical protein GUITHDRAFT_142092 [Guillardia theta CCMP2712]|uniref:PDZ domain-containing protein n=1 Tax=Guillardia theta (strain CCMP2712) TaxID=905079 RepID=L1IZS4_GUITC|nr:hypothetical protein GUITHDRAFT_142092 [Guillardia theta CCMP2712]EKX41409.1 hypothetical protein GUITHDRAFT_142092 [Guillardia theta CCMP2712]|eukprot:XP_005828389.1 hypothetical protein GUITHDRAFT_142092 [Guillardia theta CCMP2712]
MEILDQSSSSVKTGNDEYFLPLFLLPAAGGSPFPSVGSVLQGSDAESQGVEEGDLVMSIKEGEEEEAEQMMVSSPLPLVQLRMRRKAGSSYRVTIRKMRSSDLLSHASSKLLLDRLLRAFQRQQEALLDVLSATQEEQSRTTRELEEVCAMQHAKIAEQQERARVAENDCQDLLLQILTMQDELVDHQVVSRQEEEEAHRDARRMSSMQKNEELLHLLEEKEQQQQQQQQQIEDLQRHLDEVDKHKEEAQKLAYLHQLATEEVRREQRKSEALSFEYKEQLESSRETFFAEARTRGECEHDRRAAEEECWSGDSDREDEDGGGSYSLAHARHVEAQRGGLRAREGVGAGTCNRAGGEEDEEEYEEDEDEQDETIEGTERGMGRTERLGRNERLREKVWEEGEE